MPKGTSSALDKFSSKFKSLDLFGESVGFTIRGNGTHQTFFGAFLSLFAIVVTISYAQDRLKTMFAYGDTTYQETKQKSNYNPTEPY